MRNGRGSGRFCAGAPSPRILSVDAYMFGGWAALAWTPNGSSQRPVTRLLGAFVKLRSKDRRDAVEEALAVLHTAARPAKKMLGPSHSWQALGPQPLYRIVRGPDPPNAAERDSKCKCVVFS